MLCKTYGIALVRRQHSSWRCIQQSKLQYLSSQVELMLFKAYGIALVRHQHSPRSFIPQSKLQCLGSQVESMPFKVYGIALVRHRKSGSFRALYLKQQTTPCLGNVLNKGIDGVWNSTCPASAFFSELHPTAQTALSRESSNRCYSRRTE